MSQENLKGTPQHEEVSSTKQPLTVDQGFEPSRRGGHGRAFSFFVARRYLFSKKKTHAINVISLISVIGVAIATMALVVVLSVFNGFHDLVAGFFTNFDPQLKVTPLKGKTVPADDPVLTQISKMPQVQVATQTVQDIALAVYQDKQAVITLKGVDDNFDDLTHINEILYGDGEFQLHTANLQFGTPGIRLAQTLGTGSYWPNFMKLYAPKRDGQLDLSNPDGGFVVDSLISSGVVFAVNQSKYDKNYMLTSLGFAQNLFGVPGMVSALEIRLKPGADIDQVKADMRRVAGERFKVQDRFEQQADTFKIMQIEKLMAYIFLTFILVVACFNIVGSLSMLIIDKKKDVVTLRNLGATDKQVNRIFLFEGRLISVIGAIVGILLGLLMCWLQQEYGFVKMGKSDGTFVVNAYPVSVHYVDVFFVFITVIVAGWLAVWYPVKTFAKRNLTI
ncbi:FtsX-like permease family protein [Hallella colorans]|uniref:Lipoprotein-releasing system permease protein n=1 Tax=Hallella colorans TaxID=1703337 RepID=A0A2U0U372_9BACT|nr:FtsX-like permease family protein [Hallella colorans]PVX51132.1 lipoprotein-releasing system permease protein [Hallella colorans]